MNPRPVTWEDLWENGLIGVTVFLGEFMHAAPIMRKPLRSLGTKIAYTTAPGNSDERAVQRPSSIQLKNDERAQNVLVVRRDRGRCGMVKWYDRVPRVGWTGDRC